MSLDILELPSVRLKGNAPPPFPLPQDSAQQTMLLLWLIELHLNDVKSEVKEKTRRELQAEFRQFLASPFLKVRGRGGGRRGVAHLPSLLLRTVWKRIRRPFTIFSQVMVRWKMWCTLPTS